MTSTTETAATPADTTKRRTVNPAFEAAAVGAKVDIAYERTRFTARAEGITEKKPRAVLVIHGMGQQLPFETLDSIANGLHREDIRHNGPGAHGVSGAHVQFGDERLERAEMHLRTQDEDDETRTQEVHIYEAYWSPLTEGEVTLKDVVQFLIAAGINGIKNARGAFRRQTFGAVSERYTPVQTILFLVIALATVLSLAVINAAIVAIPAARSPFEKAPTWLSDGLFRDITDVFNAVVLVLGVFALTIIVSMFLSHARSWFRFWAWLRALRWLLALIAGIASLIAFVLAIFAILGAGVAVPALFIGHSATPNAQLLPAWLSDLGAGVPDFIRTYGTVVAALLVLFYFVLPVIRGLVRKTKQASASRVTSLIVLALFIGIGYGLYRLAGTLIGAAGRPQLLTPDVTRSAPIWALLVVVAFIVRSFLIQYLGDVAVYVQSHTLDRFFELRLKIKDTARRTAEAIYAQKSNGADFDYDEIVVVGHSLGSVVVYDTLNRLLLDDQCPNTKRPTVNAASRTKLLLTFGSPLDKTAFLFATQAKKRSMTDMREYLTSLIQPLIDVPAVRRQIPWINVYSPWDIISGHLDFYDDPQHPGIEVQNERDAEAVTLLGAHTEYWRNWLVFERLHQQLTA